MTGRRAAVAVAEIELGRDLGFFRRQSFPMAPNKTPKWHRLKEQTVGTMTHADGRKEKAVKVEAFCGYTRIYSAALGDPLNRRAAVATKKIRCAKCDAKHEAQRPKGDRYAGYDGDVGGAS